MKPELFVSINVDTIECDENSTLVSKDTHLRKVFRARLADFVDSHPEIDEVPEELLPEPFNPSKPALRSEFEAKFVHVDVLQNREFLSFEPLVQSNESSVTSHFSPSFCKHFSVKVAINKDVQQSYISSPQLTQNEQFPVHSSSGAPLPCAADSKWSNARNAEDDSAAFQSTPAKSTSASSEFMSATPALPPERRCYITPNEDSISSRDNLLRRATRPRSLKFEDPRESEEGNFVNDNIY